MCTREKIWANVKQSLNMSYTQQAHLSEKRETAFVLVGSVHTKRVLVTLTWFSSACDFFDPSISTHMLQVRSKRATAGLYLCECSETTRQLNQHAGFVIIVLQWPSCVQAVHLHHRVKRLSQHVSLILNYSSELMMHIQ